MKREFTAITLTLLVAGLVWIVGLRKPSSIGDSAPSADLASAGSHAVGSVSPPLEVAPPGNEWEAEPAPELPSAVAPAPKPLRAAAAEESLADPGVATADNSLPPTTVIENMRSALRQYHARFRENPVGDNAEITRLLSGENPRQAVFLQSEDGLRVNGQGQIIDHWGTPFFFHALSRNEMEIRSAGPDRRLWTSDDLASK